MKIFNQSIHFCMLLGLSCIMACADPDGNVVTQGQDRGFNEEYSISFAHVVKDSAVDPAHPGKSFRLQVAMPYAFRSGCYTTPQNRQVYVGMEFDAPIAGGTTLSGAVPSLSHNFEHTFPGQCADNRVFWFMLPEGYNWGSDIFVHTHATNITADRSNADGLVVIANIDAQDPMQAVAIPHTTILSGIKNPKGEAGTAPVKDPGTTTSQTVEPIKQPATKEGN